MAEDQSAQDTAPPATETSGEPNFANKHPLEHHWTLWFDVGSSGKQDVATWGGTLRSVYTFESVEDFWWYVDCIRANYALHHGDEVQPSAIQCSRRLVVSPCTHSLYNNIAAPSKLQHGMDMHLFKKGVEPKWEDKGCIHGGCWRVQLPPAKGAKQNLTDTAWLHAVRLVVHGEASWIKLPHSCWAASGSNLMTGMRFVVWWSTCARVGIAFACGHAPRPMRPCRCV